MPVLFDFTEFPVLRTDRLVLRQIRQEDAGTIVKLFSDPEVLRFLNQPPITTREQALSYIERLATAYQDHRAIDWAITLRDQDQMIGQCAAYAWDQPNRRIDIGYDFLPSAWGKGYATEAARAMIRWCFLNLDLHRIQADCTLGNDASERVMIKCGFTLEGIWRESCWEHGRFVDIKQYGLLRREFPDL